MRIVDDYDLMFEKAAQDHFTNGFRLGTKLMIECLYNRADDQENG